MSKSIAEELQAVREMKMSMKSRPSSPRNVVASIDARRKSVEFNFESVEDIAKLKEDLEASRKECKGKASDG